MCVLLRVTAVGVCVVWLLGTSHRGAAHEPDAPMATGDHAAARRDVEIAGIHLRLYERVDYPLRLRQIDTEIQLAEAELASLKRIEAQYRSFERIKYSSPLVVTRENTKLRILEAELRLKNLRHEKLLLQRYHRDQLRLMRLALERAQQQARHRERPES